MFPQIEGLTFGVTANSLYTEHWGQHINSTEI